MDFQTFIKLLEIQYNGDVVPVERFITSKSVMLFHCKVCETSFMNRPELLVGTQRHNCTYNYPDNNGVRTKNKHRKKLDQTKKRLSRVVKNNIDLLYDRGLSIKYIALQSKESVGSVIYYLEKSRKN